MLTTRNLIIRSLIFAAFFCGAVQGAAAQKGAAAKVMVSGSVKTTDGKPAEFISVSLKETFYGAVTDAKGGFSFEAPAGSYTMVVSSISAHRKEFPVEIVAGQRNVFPDLTVIEDVKSLEQVVVTGQFSPQSLRNSVYRVKVVDREKIEQKAAVDVQSLLNTEIGIRLTNDMALGETDFELMGMSGNNVKVLIDGVPVIDRGAKKQSLSQMDINTIERVEIVEGPMSVVYGTDALAGVINIITRKGPPASGKDQWSISAGVHEETAGDEYGFLDGKGVHKENIQLGWTGRSGLHASAGFARNTNGGWKGDQTGRQKVWMPNEQYMYNGVLRYSKEKFSVWYRLDYLDEEKIYYYNGTELVPNEVTDKKYQTDRLTNMLQAEWSVSNRLSLDAAASYQDYERRTRTEITDTDTGEWWHSDAESDQDVSTMQAAFFRASATWRAIPRLTFQPGVEYQWTKASGERIEGSPAITDAAIYLSAEWRATEWLNVRPGVRKIINSDYNAPFAVPSVLTKFSLTDYVDLRLSYGYGFRAPTLRELHMSFFNANHDITGNPDLKAEHSNNVSASLTWRILHGGDVRLTSTLTGFYNDFRNKIDFALTDGSSNPQKYTYANIDRQKTLGGTLENNFAWKNLGASLGISLVGIDNDLYDDGDYPQEDIDKFHYSPEVNASVSYKFRKSGTDLSLFYKFTGSRDTYAFSTTQSSLLLRKRDSFHWADFTVGQKVGNYLKLSAGVKNIFDVTTVRDENGGGMGSTGDYTFMGCGRSYFIGLNFLFNK